MHFEWGIWGHFGTLPALALEKTGVPGGLSRWGPPIRLSKSNDESPSNIILTDSGGWSNENRGEFPAGTIRVVMSAFGCKVASLGALLEVKKARRAIAQLSPDWCGVIVEHFFRGRFVSVHYFGCADASDAARNRS